MHLTFTTSKHPSLQHTSALQRSLYSAFAATAWLTTLASSLGVEALLTADSSGLNNAAAARAALLKVGSESDAFIRFNLEVLPADTSADDVSRAILKLYVSKVNRPGLFTVHTAESPWQEGTGKPVKGAPAGDGAVEIHTNDQKSFVAIDVTSTVKSWMTNPASNDGFVLSGTQGNFAFDSKENTATSHPPVLDVTIGTAGVEVSEDPITEASTTAGARTIRRVAVQSITTKKIKDGAVTSVKIADGEVSSVDIAAGAVGTAQIGDGAVTSPKIAAGAVGTAQLGQGAISNQVMAPNSVATANLQPGSVSFDKLAALQSGESVSAGGFATAPQNPGEPIISASLPIGRLSRFVGDNLDHRQTSIDRNYRRRSGC